MRVVGVRRSSYAARVAATWSSWSSSANTTGRLLRRGAAQRSGGVDVVGDDGGGAGHGGLLAARPGLPDGAYRQPGADAKEVWSAVVMACTVPPGHPGASSSCVELHADAIAKLRGDMSTTPTAGAAAHNTFLPRHGVTIHEVIAAGTVRTTMRIISCV